MKNILQQKKKVYQNCKTFKSQRVYLPKVNRKQSLIRKSTKVNEVISSNSNRRDRKDWLNQIFLKHIYFCKKNNKIKKNYKSKAKQVLSISSGQRSIHERHFLVDIRCTMCIQCESLIVYYTISDTLSSV